MDILLTHGYFLHEDPLEKQVMKPYPQLGLLYISAYLKSKGFGVEVLDTTFQTRRVVFEQLERQRPAVVGIYCNLMTKPNVLAMIAQCKRLGTTVILGGPEPPFYAEEYLKSGADIIVVGEGERTLAELLPLLAKKDSAALATVAGIVYRKEDGAICRTSARTLIANLDELPFPDRAAINLQTYLQVWQKHHHQRPVSLITARGCPYTCTWCSHSVYGVSHRRRSPGNVADEIEYLVAGHAPDSIWYADDVFTIHHRWFFDYARELNRRDLILPFECISREDRLNEEVVKTLAEMGCSRLWIGAESGSQRILDAMQRRTNAARVREMTKLLQKHGIEAGMFIMLGYHGETEEDLLATAEHLKLANPDIFLTTVSYPIKGTAYYSEVESSIISGKNWADRTDRDLVVTNRPSKSYYRHANRWLVNEVALHKQIQAGTATLTQKARAFVNSRLGRLGMAIAKRRRP